ncbi:hypothetical protein MalM14_18060 [Gimesia chilikensis]|nr:hypothetical protein MalM14_18060 [Gimesia chilikensis]
MPEPGAPPRTSAGSVTPLRSIFSVSPGTAGRVGSPPTTAIVDVLLGRMLNVSSSSPPVTVVPPGAEIPPTRSTVPPTASGSPALGSTKMPMVVAALIWEVASMVKSSPAVRTTLDPVDSTVTPALMVKSSPAIAESPAVSVTVPEPDTLLATVSGLAAVIRIKPEGASTPDRPSTVPISRAPVLLIKTSPPVVDADSRETARSRSSRAFAGSPISPAARNASSFPEISVSSPKVLS